MSRLPILHIGMIIPLCGIVTEKPTRTLRSDLTAREYRSYAQGKAFRDQEKTRLCKRCMAAVKARERRCNDSL